MSYLDGDETIPEAVLGKIDDIFGEKAAIATAATVMFGLPLAAVVGAVVGVGALINSEVQNHKAGNRVEEMFAEALASNRLQLSVQTVDGRTVNLNDLSPKERALTVLNAGKRYTNGASRDPVYTHEVNVAISDAKQGEICTLTVDPSRLDLVLKGGPAPALTTEQATKYAEALGRKCGLDDKKIEAMKVNLISTIKVSASPQGPYSTVATNGVMVEQRLVEPKVVTRA